MRTGRNDVRFFDAGKRRTCAGVRGRNYIGSFGKIIRANGDNFSGVSGCTNSLWVRSLIAGRSNHDNTGIPKLINFADKSTVFGIGMPVIGANVVEKGTTNGTITDAEGRFSLNVASDATLIVSYIGSLLSH